MLKSWLNLLLMNLAIFSLGMFLFINFAQAEQDVIGIKVFENAGDYTDYPVSYINGILTPEAWYLENVPNPGSPQNIEIDGYSGIRDGRTIYVGCTNYRDDFLQSYIFVISFNEGAAEPTTAILSELLNSWECNANINDEVMQSAIRRDYERVIKINSLRASLENYKVNIGQYPRLDQGTYQTGWSYSVWPSWQETLGRELAVTLPVDPINQLQGCNAPGVDIVTCWNEASSQFTCPQDVKAFAYQSQSQGDEYVIYTNFEFKDDGSWQPATGDASTTEGCFEYEIADKNDDDLDGILNQVDICPQGDLFELPDSACTDDNRYKYVTLEELNSDEVCFKTRYNNELCYQSRPSGNCDTDQDGIGDACDSCPLDPLNDIDQDGFCMGAIFRGDKLGGDDNCPKVYNPDQKNSDQLLEIASGLVLEGDACDATICGNNILEEYELCDLNQGTPLNATCSFDCKTWSCNEGYSRINNECIADNDGDDVPDYLDNCGDVFNPDQLNADEDQYGDACDYCPDDPRNDEDADGVCAGHRFMAPRIGANDNCEFIPNPDQANRDGDEYGDVCDYCPDDFRNDSDEDGYCWCPSDNYGVPANDPTAQGTCSFQNIYRAGAHDNCPVDYNPAQSNLDSDLDNMGDVCDLATCGDGTIGGYEVCDRSASYPDPDQDPFDGSSRLHPYSCSNDCVVSGGWCGDNIIQDEYEDCDGSASNVYGDPSLCDNKCNYCFKDGELCFKIFISQGDWRREILPYVSSTTVQSYLCPGGICPSSLDTYTSSSNIIYNEVQKDNRSSLFFHVDYSQARPTLSMVFAHGSIDNKHINKGWICVNNCDSIIPGVSDYYDWGWLQLGNVNTSTSFTVTPLQWEGITQWIAKTPGDKETGEYIPDINSPVTISIELGG